MNIKKTHYMLISSHRKTAKVEVLNIKKKDCIKYLGIYVDKNLNWSAQIQHIDNKLSKNLGIFYKLRYLLLIYNMAL